MTSEMTATELDALEKRVCGDRADGRVMSGDRLDVIDFRKIIAAARREQKMREVLTELHGNVMVRYSGKDGHRNWWSGGTWLRPGDLLIEANESDLSALKDMT